jgi:hypothetical protein
MGKKSPKAPPAPDPVATANAQAAANKETAIANAELGFVNQNTPYGSLTYTQRGTSAAGTPQYESNIVLSPEQQQLLNLSQQGDLGTAQLGLDQLGRISQAVSSPFSFAGLPSYGEADQTAASARAEEALMSRLNPQFQRDEEALRTRLINQGIGQGSQAYQREMESFNQARNDARTQAILGGQQFGNQELAAALQRRNQGIQEYTTQRNAPLNEYTALTSGTQIQNPQFQSSQGGNMNPVDIAGLTQNAYNAQLGQYNARVAGNNATTGALLGAAGNLGGSFLGSPAGSAAVLGLFSDIRLKQDIVEVGERNGHKLYEFSYIPKVKKSGRFIGVMAQDVEKYMPEAVMEIEGFKAVNYAMLGLEMREVA